MLESYRLQNFFAIPLRLGGWAARILSESAERSKVGSSGFNREENGVESNRFGLAVSILEAFWKHFGERKGWNQGVLHRTDRAWRHLTLIAMCGKLRWSAANHLIPTYAESTTSITGRPGLRLGAH